ncbi:MAG: hypothetical protein RMJ98_04200 [Myxococcales bacterium]|nr:hypothetical protein [Polyangiaceae bacterium]MDW8248492.1 hypothetical protein [Myxococcales bacterium]
MAVRRQLPILNQKMASPAGAGTSPEEGADRPPWHWSAIGAVLIFALWLPLAMVGQWLSRGLLGVLVPVGTAEETEAFLARATGAVRWSVRTATVGPPLLGFALACLAGGAMVGRFGGQAGAKEAAVAGVVAASTAWALTAARVGLGATWMLWPPVALLGAGFALAGSCWGERQRPRP